MITIKELKEIGFFDKINEIQAMGTSLGITEIYVTPPVIDSSYVHLMFTINIDGLPAIQNEIKFRDALENLFDKKLNFHLFQKSEAEEAFQEKSVFADDYQNAMMNGVLIENLNAEEELDKQWKSQKTDISSTHLHDNQSLTQPIEKNPELRDQSPVELVFRKRKLDKSIFDSCDESNNKPRGSWMGASQKVGV